MVYGLDVSDWQGYVTWNSVLTNVTPKISFAYAKATDGITGAQATFQHNHDACDELNIPFGAYHFFESYDDPIVQARSFIRMTLDSGRGGQLIPMVDVESGLPTASDLLRFCHEVELAFRVPFILIYTDSEFWDNAHLNDALSEYPLWITNFVRSGPGTAAALPATGGWKDWTVWQYDNEGQVAGIGNTDIDQCRDLAVIRRPGL